MTHVVTSQWHRASLSFSRSWNKSDIKLFYCSQNERLKQPWIVLAVLATHSLYPLYARQAINNGYRLWLAIFSQFHSRFSVLFWLYYNVSFLFFFSFISIVRTALRHIHEKHDWTERKIEGFWLLCYLVIRHEAAILEILILWPWVVSLRGLGAKLKDELIEAWSAGVFLVTYISVLIYTMHCFCGEIKSS